MLFPTPFTPQKTMLKVFPCLRASWTRRRMSTEERVVRIDSMLSSSAARTTEVTLHGRVQKTIPFDASELLPEDFGAHILANTVRNIRRDVLLHELCLTRWLQTHFLLQRIDHGTQLFVCDRRFAHQSLHKPGQFPQSPTGGGRGRGGFFFRTIHFGFVLLVNRTQGKNKVLNHVASYSGVSTVSIQRADIHVVVLRHQELALLLLLRLCFGLLLFGILPIKRWRALRDIFLDFPLFGLSFGLNGLRTRI